MGKYDLSISIHHLNLCQADEEQVNTLTEKDPAAPRLLSLTLRRLSHCVVAVLDRCAESMEAT